MKEFSIIVLSLFVASTSCFAQVEDQDSILVTAEKKKLTKEEKREAKWAKKEEKELRKSERQLEAFQRKQLTYVLNKEIVSDSSFVLEATELYNRNGRSVPASPSINFIAVSGDSLVLQIGSDFGLGPNGVGGITLEGRILGYEVKDGPGYGTLSVNISVKSVILGLASVLIKVTDTGNFRASVRGSWRQQITMSGNFRTWESSKIFKGRTTRSLYGPY